MEVVNAGSGDAFNSDGGHPFAADGPLYLCSRADPVPCTNDRSPGPWRGPGSGGERARGGRTSTSRRARCPPTLLGAVPSAIFGGRTPTRPSVDPAPAGPGEIFGLESTSREVHEGTMRSAAVGPAPPTPRCGGVCHVPLPPRPQEKKNCALRGAGGEIPGLAPPRGSSAAGIWARAPPMHRCGPRLGVARRAMLSCPTPTHRSVSLLLLPRHIFHIHHFFIFSLLSTSSSGKTEQAEVAAAPLTEGAFGEGARGEGRAR